MALKRKGNILEAIKYIKKALEIDYNQIYQHPESQLFDNCCQSLGIIKEEKRKCYI